MNSTYFAYRPRKIEELLKACPIEQQKKYMIEKTIVLSNIEYENFINDMYVERSFIEKNKSLCKIDEEDIFHCILIKNKVSETGILIMSDDVDYPKWAGHFIS